MCYHTVSMCNWESFIFNNFVRLFVTIIFLTYIMHFSDGLIWLRDLENDRYVFEGELGHLSDVCSVDITNQGKIIASGGRDNTFSLWKLNSHNDSCATELMNINSFRMHDTVWKVCFCNEDRHVAVGTGGNYGNPLVIYDIET